MPPLTGSATQPFRKPAPPRQAPERPSDRPRATQAQQVTYAEKFRVDATLTAPGPGTWISGVSSL